MASGHGGDARDGVPVDQMERREYWSEAYACASSTVYYTATGRYRSIAGDEPERRQNHGETVSSLQCTKKSGETCVHFLQMR